LQFDDPAVPGPDYTFALPGGNDIPEQGIIDGEILSAVTELVFASTKTTNTPTRKNALLENAQVDDHPLQRSTASKARHSGTDNGD